MAEHVELGAGFWMSRYPPTSGTVVKNCESAICKTEQTARLRSQIVVKEAGLLSHFPTMPRLSLAGHTPYSAAQAR